MSKFRKQIAALETERDKKIKAAEEIFDLTATENRELTAEEQTTFDDLMAGVSAAKDRINMAKQLQTEALEAPALKVPETVAGSDRGLEVPDGSIIIPANSYALGRLRSFTDSNGLSAEQRAYQAGRWIMGCVGHQRSQQWCSDHGIGIRKESDYSAADHRESVNTRGGYLVPEQIDRDIIRLVLEYGKFRNDARVVPMTTDVVRRPRRTSGITANWEGEGDEGTESNMTWDEVTLTAKKMMALARITNELSEDAIISVADSIIREIAYAFVKEEDEAGFTGDGTSTNGGIFGVTERLLDVNGVDNGGGLILGTGNLMSEITLKNLIDVIAILPDFADTNAKWYVNKFFYYHVMINLVAAAGGNTIASLQAGPGNAQFMGDPVVFTNTLPKTDANSQILALYGDMYLTADFGDRRRRTISFSNDATVGGTNVFAADQMAIRGTQRIDINVHDVGDADNAGPMVGLISAAS
jgi:HK97 family phage major capsid protein